ncbi:methyltransferase domain-containing protein [Rhodoplanes sp. TEM]|uniref:Methyltransferase domain-containing protein n=1 Tax=Rhodoplanes tepidamans TaxID=200616 RepID=A0ABT5JA15_RHOTP|nr:methyltransferase domain-containing protein [Rhodoplanes tepidamans]MDC7786523.1 methyltransferase domain-containing protein [Rhodoplanes tepidamans]MDC7983139.1 methyltransferase domain-containing protein [Rhodoplanes sp. TEM]MDQ0357597.1 putative SAM-dependent methyltransferase [Rhodoplanes tepidamans]
MDGVTKYNFGCGNSRKAGFVNVDVRADSAADVVANAWETERFPQGTAALVYSRHMLEHLDPDDARLALCAWLRLLRPGGLVNVIVPDIAFHARQVLGLSSSVFPNQYDHACAGFWGWRDEVRGGSREDAHRWGYVESSLAHEMAEAGFVDIQRVNEGPDVEPWHLNMLARRPL